MGNNIETKVVVLGTAHWPTLLQAVRYCTEGYFNFGVGHISLDQSNVDY
jgi:hypothetical protein